MIASLGIGMQADSRVIRQKTATTPAEPMNSVARSTIGSTTLSVMAGEQEEGVHQRHIVGTMRARRATRPLAARIWA